MFVLVLGGVAFVGFQLLKDKVPISGRSRLILVPWALEKRLVNNQYRSLLAQHSNDILPQNHPAVARIRELANEIISHNLDLCGTAPDGSPVNWSFIVIRKSTVNAFVMPGGKVCLFTGLLDLLQSDDELAVVLSHEIGHQVCRHVAEKLTKSVVLLGPTLILANYFDWGFQFASWVTSLVFELPNSRKLETEADWVGLNLMVNAHRSPHAAPSVFEKLAAKNQNNIGFLSTHPSDERRIQTIRGWLPDLMNRYQQKLMDDGVQPDSDPFAEN